MKILVACGPKERFVINDRIDDGPFRVGDGEIFEVSDDSGRGLLAQYFPRLQPALEPEKKPVKAEPGMKENPAEAASKPEAKRTAK